jgi:ABC-type uncharacterized transport system ATPase component
MTHVSAFSRGLLPESYAYLLFFIVVVMALKIVLDLFFITDMGLTMGAMGVNEQMVIVQGVNPEVLKLIGVGLSNGLVAVSGAFAAQYQGFADVNLGQVISDLTLHIKPGEFVTIIGSNGAGKTTLFNLISGALFPSSGIIRLNGEEVTTTPEYKRARHIGRIFQDPLRGTASNMSVEDNMMIACRKGFKWPVISLNRKLRADFRARLEQLDMDLQDRMKENVGNLSGGQRQALTLLMMVMSSPSIILLDEHTAALDPHNARIVMDLTS